MISHAVIHQAKLRHPFGISRSVDTQIPTVLYQIEGVGQGEGSPVRYKKQQAHDVLAALLAYSKNLTEQNIDDIEGHDAAMRAAYPDLSAATCALNLALWDARGRRHSKPLHELFGTPRMVAPTTYTISLSDHDTMAKRAEEASHLPFLKVKLGRTVEFDIEAMRRVHKAAPDALLRVDANAGWTLEDCRTIIPQLADLGVEFVEQPLAIGNFEDLATLNRESPLPIVVDEDAQDAASLEPLKGKCWGINIKLMKCGGLSEALKMITIARSEGWKVLVGCMIETRLGLGGAAHLAGLVDYMDLDAHMLCVNDPFPDGNPEVPESTIPLPQGNGIGLPFFSVT